MNAPEKFVRELHAELYVLCGLPAVAPTMGGIMAWGVFLQELKPLNSTPGGPFTIKDLRAVLKGMKKQNDAGKAKWSLRPTTILRDPEKFLDLVLESRRNFRPRQAPETTVQTLPGGLQRQLDPSEVETTEFEVGNGAYEELQRLKRKAGMIK